MIVISTPIPSIPCVLVTLNDSVWTGMVNLLRSWISVRGNTNEQRVVAQFYFLKWHWACCSPRAIFIVSGPTVEFSTAISAHHLSVRAIQSNLMETMIRDGTSIFAREATIIFSPKRHRDWLFRMQHMPNSYELGDHQDSRCKVILEY